MILDFSKPHGVIVGHDIARYEQDGVLYRANGSLVNEEDGARIPDLTDISLPDDNLESASVFLRNVLADGPLSKATVFRACQDNNQDWESVKRAAVKAKVEKFQFQKNETWRLEKTK